MRISRVVSERDSGQPIGACTVSVGEQYTHTDPTGRYDLRTRWQRQTAIKFVAAGYAVQTKSLNAESTRYPVVDVELVRLRASSAPPGARFDPYTGEPLVLSDRPPSRRGSNRPLVTGGGWCGGRLAGRLAR